MNATVDLSFEPGRPPDEPAQLKIQSEDWELNVWLTHDDVQKLRGLGAASWDDRKSIRAGVAAEASVFWCSEGERVIVLIGHDDETWDFTVSFVGVSTLLAELALA